MPSSGNTVPSLVLIAIPCLMRGGTEMQTLQLVRVLAWRGGYDVTVVCYFESDREVVAEFEAAGARVRLLNLSRSMSPAALVLRLRAEFRALKPQLLHVQYLAPGLLPIIAARLAGCRKVLATVHQPWTPDNHGLKARCLLRFAARLSTRFICVSEAAERSWFGGSHLYTPAGPGTRQPRHSTIHNAIDLARIDSILQGTNRTELRNQLGFGTEPVIGVVSRLTGEKGVDILLEAMPAILRQVPNARLLVVGDGIERPALEAQARTLGLSQSAAPRPLPPVSCSPTPDSCPLSPVPCSHLSTLNSQLSTPHAPLSSLLSPLSRLKHPPSTISPSPPSTINHQPSTIVWTGLHPWSRCIQLISAMDLVVVPSRFEGFGLTVAEAMACRKPVVASNVGALAEVIGDGAGALFNPGDPADLASKVLAQLGNPTHREQLSRSGRARVENAFSLDHFRNRIHSLYSEVLGERRPQKAGSAKQEEQGE